MMYLYIHFVFTNLFSSPSYYIGTEIIGVCVFLWCFTVTSTYRTDILLPKWSRELSDENSTDIPEFLTKLQDQLLYPTKIFIQKMFSGQHQIDKSRMLQVPI